MNNKIFKKNQKEKWNQIRDFNFNQNIIPLTSSKQ
jgi:hypothetical protein